MRDWCDAADHPEGCMFDNGQTMVSAKRLALQKFDARRPLAKRFELLDLVLQPSDLGLFHFHRAQFDALVDGNPANVIDNSLASFQSMLAKLLKRLVRRCHG